MSFLGGTTWGGVGERKGMLVNKEGRMGVGWPKARPIAEREGCNKKVTFPARSHWDLGQGLVA